MCSTKLNRINHLSCGQFGDNVSLLWMCIEILLIMIS
jgi:hypothetical protein